MPTRPTRTLETFPNPHPNNTYTISHVCPEYTALCPVTGQPDFGAIRITYVPGPRCVELKSLKLYIWSFRDEGHFFEDVTNVILNDLVAAMEPARCEVVGEFNVRGGITTTVTATFPAQSITMPPLTSSISPVTKAASSEAR